jgi:hypothetical protein
MELLNLMELYNNCPPAMETSIEELTQKEWERQQNYIEQGVAMNRATETLDQIRTRVRKDFNKHYLHGYQPDLFGKTFCNECPKECDSRERI